MEGLFLFTVIFLRFCAYASIRLLRFFMIADFPQSKQSIYTSITSIANQIWTSAKGICRKHKKAFCTPKAKVTTVGVLILFVLYLKLGLFVCLVSQVGTRVYYAIGTKISGCKKAQGSIQYKYSQHFLAKIYFSWPKLLSFLMVLFQTWNRQARQCFSKISPQTGAL